MDAPYREAVATSTGQESGTVAFATPPDDISEIPDGTPLAEIAARYDVTVTRRKVTTAGLPPLPHGPARRYDTARIVKLYAEGHTEEVAAEVGCAGNHRQQVPARGRTWSGTRSATRHRRDSPALPARPNAQGRRGGRGSLQVGCVALVRAGV
jgi:hypothetical protein